MKKIILLLLAVLPLSILAQDITKKEGQWGAGVSFGMSTAEGDSNSLGSFDSFFTFGGLLEYRQNNNISYKLGTFSGEDSIANIFAALFGDEGDYSYRTTYISASARTSSPFHFFASLGLAHTSETVEFDNIPDLSESSVNLLAEVGLGWEIGEHFALNVSLMKTNAELSDIESGSLQAVYRF